jgi:hypothetical protein
VETDDTFELRVTPGKDPALFGRRDTDLLIKWDGTTDDGPDYQELIKRLKDWAVNATNRASAIRDIG